MSGFNGGRRASSSGHHQSTNTIFKPINPAMTAIMLLITVYLLPAASFFPDLLPNHDWLSSWINEYRYAIRALFLLYLVFNLFQAVFAMMICTYMDYDGHTTVKWGVSVLINGLFALRLLIKNLFVYEWEQRQRAHLFEATATDSAAPSTSDMFHQSPSDMFFSSASTTEDRFAANQKPLFHRRSRK